MQLTRLINNESLINSFHFLNWSAALISIFEELFRKTL